MVFMSWPPSAALMPNLGAAWPSALIRSCSTYIDLVMQALLVAAAVAAVPVAVLLDRRVDRWLVLLEARRALGRGRVGATDRQPPGPSHDQCETDSPDGTVAGSSG